MLKTPRMSVTKERQATAGTLEILGTEEMSTTAGPQQQQQNSMNSKKKKNANHKKEGHQQW
jgi:hypothetical protein